MSLEPFGGMMRFAVTAEFDAACVITSDAAAGELYHVERNSHGGANFTPVARFFAWQPALIECFHAHWRVDCFVRSHRLSPDPEFLGNALAKALLHEAVCSQPLWVSWHRSDEIGGKPFGDVFDFD
jgi:hypothetical protein